MTNQSANSFSRFGISILGAILVFIAIQVTPVLVVHARSVKNDAVKPLPKGTAMNGASRLDDKSLVARIEKLPVLVVSSEFEKNFFAKSGDIAKELGAQGLSKSKPFQVRVDFNRPSAVTKQGKYYIHVASLPGATSIRLEGDDLWQISKSEKSFTDDQRKSLLVILAGAAGATEPGDEIARFPFLANPDASPAGKQEYVLRLGSRCRANEDSGQSRLCAVEIGLSEVAPPYAVNVLSSKVAEMVAGLESKPDVERGLAWTSGEEHSWSDLYAYVFPLGRMAHSNARAALSYSPGGVRNAVLVTHVAGFEHTHRAHTIYASLDGKNVVEIWRGSEGQGPTSSEVGFYRPMVSAAAGAQAKEAERAGAMSFYFIKMGFFADAFSEMADEWVIESFAWDSEKNRVAAVTNERDRAMAWATVAGHFSTVKLALEYKEAHKYPMKADLTTNTYFRGYLVVSAEVFPKLGEKSGFFLAKFWTDKTKADEEKNYFNKLKSSLAITVKQAR